MKKRFLPIAIFLLLAVAACGGNPQDLVNQAGEAATRLAEEAGDVAATAAAVATDIADGPDSEEGAPEPTPEPTEVPTEAPTEVPTEAPTEEPTEEPTKESEEHPIFDELLEDVVLRGAIVAIEGGQFNLIEEGEIEVGFTYLFSNQPWGQSFPAYNIHAGDTTLAADINKVSGGHLLIAVLVPNLSETELGKAANDALLNTTLTVTAVGESNQPVKPDDLMEVVLTDPNSSSLPYTVNFYRGEARELVATFTINTQ